MGPQTIADGISLHVIPTKKFKTVSLSILIRQPLARSTVTVNALIPQILQRGCAKYDTISKIKSKTENLFGSVFEIQIVKKGEQQLIQFFMEFVSRSNDGLTDECLTFLKDMMLYPLTEGDGFKQEYVNSEKESLKLDIEGRVNNKAEYAKLRCVSEMCRDEPFGLYGDGFIEDLHGINARNAYEHYQKLLNEAPIDFIVIGDVDEAQWRRKVTELFAFKRGPCQIIPKAKPCCAPRKPNKVVEEIGLTQGKICVGFRSGVDPVSDEYYKLLVTNELYGGGSSSELFTNVREKESLCYYINTFIYRFKTIMLMQSGVDPDNFQKTLDLAGRVLQGIAEGQASDTAFESAKKSLVKKLQGVKDYPSASMDFYASQIMLSDSDHLGNVIEKIRKVKKEDICTTAQKLYRDTIYLLK